MKFNAILILYLILSFSYISCRGEDEDKKNNSGAAIASVAAAVFASPPGYILAWGFAIYLVSKSISCGISSYQCHQKGKCEMKNDYFGCSFESE